MLQVLSSHSLMKRYRYPAKCVRVIDGDTVELEIDLGFKCLHRNTFRLYGINTPDLHDKDAEKKKKAWAARFRIEGLVSGVELEVETLRDKADKHGRYLAEIWIPDTTTVGIMLCVNGILVKEGLAEET